MSKRLKTHEGLTTSKRVMWFQDWTFMMNDKRDRRLTDEELLREWRREFPMARGNVFKASFEKGLSILRGVRAHYNIGRQGHGHRSPAGELMGGAERLSLPYAEDGNRYPYSERWLQGVLSRRPDFDRPRERERSRR